MFHFDYDHREGRMVFDGNIIEETPSTYLVIVTSSVTSLNSVGDHISLQKRFLSREMRKAIRESFKLAHTR